MAKIKKSIIFILCASLAFAANAATPTSRLHKVMQSIARLRSSITRAHHQSHTLQHQLRSTELRISDLSSRLTTTKHKIDDAHQIMRELQHENYLYTQQLATQKKDLAQQMRSAYIFGHTTYFRLLLNNRDPQQLSRILNYYTYIQKAQLDYIAAIKITLKRLDANKRAINRQTAKLTDLEYQQHVQYHHLQNNNKIRTLLLKNINQRLRTQRQKLSHLMSDKKNLENLIKRLKALAAAQAFVTPHGKIVKNLHWPTHGRVLDLYGHSINNSQIKWTGVLIKAPFGQQVRSIATGKVIFAQWLQGYGLLIIINHGKGYMTLYGRNNTLYKKVGDIVKKNELIATVGESGGFKEPALYFAIRHNGVPVNPKRYCRG